MEYANDLDLSGETPTYNGHPCKLVSLTVRGDFTPAVREVMKNMGAGNTAVIEMDGKRFRIWIGKNGMASDLNIYSDVAAAPAEWRAALDSIADYVIKHGPEIFPDRKK